MAKPDDIPQDVWDAARNAYAGYGRAGEYDETLRIYELIARAIMAAKAEAHRDLVDCLDDMTRHYVELAGCGDCGFWDPEQESEVIAARKMIAAHRSVGDVNTAHNKNNSEA